METVCLNQKQNHPMDALAGRLIGTYPGIVGIPVKLNALPKESRTVFRDDPEHHRSVATLAT